LQEGAIETSKQKVLYNFNRSVNYPKAGSLVSLATIRERWTTLSPNNRVLQLAFDDEGFITPAWAANTIALHTLSDLVG
jgi:hypothetical protein